MNREFLNIKFFATLFFLILISSLIRFGQPDDGLTFDEAEYALAAKKGIVANALDLENTRGERHYHGPVVVYLIKVAELFGGQSEKAFRAPSRLFGVLTVVALFAGCVFVYPNGFWIGFIAAFLLAVLPSHAHMSGVANFHAFTVFLTTISYFLLAYAIKQRSKTFFLLLAVTLGVFFASMEYSIIVAAIVAVALVMVPNPWIRINLTEFRVTRIIYWFVLIVGLTFLFLWPAGLIKLGIIKNFLYYIHYSAGGHPILFRGELTQHVPWWAYFYWFFALSPAWLILACVSFVYMNASFILKKPKDREILLMVYSVILLIVLFRQHIMSARYAVYVLPFMCMYTGIFLFKLKNRLNNIGLISVLLLLAIVFVTNYSHLQPSVQGDPGFKEAATFLKKNAQSNDNILAWYQPILRFYLPDFPNVYNYKKGYTSPEQIVEIKDGKYKFILYYHNQVRRWPDDKALQYVKTHFELVYIYHWENQPFLWIYKSPF